MNFWEKATKGIKFSIDSLKIKALKVLIPLSLSFSKFIWKDKTKGKDREEVNVLQTDLQFLKISKIRHDGEKS